MGSHALPTSPVVFFWPPSASQLLFIIQSHLLFLFLFNFLSVFYLFTVFPSWFFSHIRPCIFVLNAVYMIYNQRVHRLSLYEWLLLQKPSLLLSLKCIYGKNLTLASKACVLLLKLYLHV